MYLTHLGGRDRPTEVRVVERRRPSRRPNRVDVSLERVDNTCAHYRLDCSVDVETIYVDGFVAEFGTDLLSGNQQETILGGKDRTQPFYRSNKVVVAEDQEVVVMLLVPTRDRIGSAVPITVDRVRVEIALVPLPFGGGRSLRRRHERQRPRNDENKTKAASDQLGAGLQCLTVDHSAGTFHYRRSQNKATLEHVHSMLCHYSLNTDHVTILRETQ